MQNLLEKLLEVSHWNYAAPTYLGWLGWLGWCDTNINDPICVIYPKASKVSILNIEQSCQASARLDFFLILPCLSLILFTEVLIPFRLNLKQVWRDFLHLGQKWFRLLALNEPLWLWLVRVLFKQKIWFQHHVTPKIL